MSAMHKPDAPTPTLDQIMSAIVGLEASQDELREMIAAAIADARPVPAIPAGWRLVPVEPTQEMWAAYRNNDQGGIFFHAAYRAKLAAAPEAAR